MLTYPDIHPILIPFPESICMPFVEDMCLNIGKDMGVRWYGLMYVIGFLAFLILGKMRARRPHSPVKPEQVDDILFYGAIGVIVGGRVGEMFFYQFPELMADPLKLFRLWEPGMSFHGGLIGVLLAMWLLARKWDLPFLKLGDFIAPMVPIGLGAGRMGNFINGELWGRPTDVPWGTWFPHVDEQQLARHPSQIYEFIGEGILLFLLLWFFSKKPRPMGAISGLFLLGYGIARSTVEFFRVPDNSDFLGIKWLTEGQLLSLPMIIAGIILLVWAYKGKNSNEAVL